MTPSGRAVVLLSFLVVLAGCTAIGLDAVSPTPTATASPDLTVELPPGVTTEAVVGPLALARAHTVALTDTTFTYRSTTVVSTTDGIRLGTVRTVRRVGSDGRFVHRMRVEGVVPSLVSNHRAVDAYSNGTMVVIRFRQDDVNKTLVTSIRESPIETTDVIGKGPLYSMLSATEPSVKGPIVRGATTYIHVKGTNGSTQLGFARATNGTFEALIAPSGLVQRYAFSYHANDSSFRDWEGRIERTVVYDDVGTTAVQRPDWVGEELPNATRVPTGR